MKRVAVVSIAFGCVLSLSAASLGWAEVRAKTTGRGAELKITVTPRGVWSPVGDVGPDTLNPTGDLNGDGHPSDAACDGGLLVAWLRPTSDAVVLAQETPSGWVLRAERPAEHGLGSPRILCTSSETWLAWNSLDDGHRAVVVESLGAGRIARLAGSTLIDVGVSGETAIVVLTEMLEDGGAFVVLGVLNPPGVPIDLGRTRIGELARLDAAAVADIRAFPAADLGFDAGRVFVTVPIGDGQLRVLSVNSTGEIVEEAIIDGSQGRGGGALPSAVRRAVTGDSR